MAYILQGHGSAEQVVRLTIDGVAVEAIAGETIARLLFRRGYKAFRRTLSGVPRGPYCGMGTCFECRVEVSRAGGAAISQRSCAAEVEDGMHIITGLGSGAEGSSG